MFYGVIGSVTILFPAAFGIVHYEIIFTHLLHSIKEGYRGYIPMEYYGYIGYIFADLCFGGLIWYATATSVIIYTMFTYSSLIYAFGMSEWMKLLR